MVRVKLLTRLQPNDDNVYLERIEGIKSTRRVRIIYTNIQGFVYLTFPQRQIGLVTEKHVTSLFDALLERTSEIR